MTRAIMDDLEGIFDDHPSLDASLRDFEPESGELTSLSPRLGNLYPSAHSGFRSDSDDDLSEASESNGNYSPPAFRRINGSGKRDSGWWRQGEDLLAGRQGSPEYDSDDGDATLEAATRTRLPTSRLGTASPEKRRSPSPDPYPTGGGDFGKTFGAIKREESEESKALIVPVADNPNNCIDRPFTLSQIFPRLTALRHSLCDARRGSTPNGAVRSCLRIPQIQI
jgi:hypothetical protein